MQTLLNAKLPAGVVAEINKLIPKFIWKCKGPRAAEMSLKKNKTEDFYLLISVLTTSQV